MRSVIFGLLTAFGSLQAINAPISYGIEDKEEAFLVRRIAEFWKDQDYKIVKSQILEFIAKYPKSKINDHLRGILGDLYLQEKKYKEALAVYDQIRASDILEKIAINKLQCHYELSQFDKMIDLGKPYLNKTNDEIAARSDEFHFLMGEAYFRYSESIPDQNKKLELLKKAEVLYEKVLERAYNDPAMFALAEIYRSRKDNQKAASFFTELALRHREQSEDLLFHAGLAQAEFDKKLAISTFSQVIEKGGAKAKDAELNRLILFFQEERFKDVIDAYPKIINEIAVEKQTALDYIIGRSYFALEDYAKASDWLTKFTRLTKENTPELRNTLLMQLNCARNLKSEEKYFQAMSSLQSHFPEDSELPQATFIHAIMLKETGKYDLAEKKLEEIIKKHPNFEDQEALYLEYSLVTFNNENWIKCHNSLNTFLKQFPKSQHAAVAWKYYLSSSLNLLKASETNTKSSYSKKHFLQDLNRVLAIENVLTPNELKECRFLQGKIAYELTQYKESLDYFNNYVATYHADASAAEAHLLIALCHNKLNGDPELFCRHAEAALKNNPELGNKSSIHLELYNVYLSLIEGMEKNPISKKDDIQLFYQLASDHLYSAMTLQDLQIKKENKLWLANYYLTKVIKQPKIYETDGAVPKDNEIYYQRSRKLFENALVSDSAFHLQPIDADHVYLEWEVMKLANYLGREKEYNKKITLLNDLVELQNKRANWNWKLQKEALLELAKTYELEGKKENAHDIFRFIAANFRKEPSLTSEYAVIHASRLKFELMRPEQKTEENQEVSKILNDLKEFQICKNSTSEPLHLEAALEYAWIRKELVNENERTAKYLFYLNRIKEDFNNVEDPLVAIYRKGLKADSEKAALFYTYIDFLNAEIARCEASLASANNSAVEKSLMEISDKATSYYLQLRAQRSISALKRSKIS